VLKHRSEGVDLGKITDWTSPWEKFTLMIKHVLVVVAFIPKVYFPISFG
jgi:exoribonuclease II